MEGIRKREREWKRWTDEAEEDMKMRIKIEGVGGFYWKPRSTKECMRRRSRRRRRIDH
jgi:hypothetical protein